MIGIFGGTFDPVHYGHIKPALSVKQALNLSQLRFVPNRLPPHRAEPWLNAEQRLLILQSALKDYPDIIIDERELKREGPSYMVDTLVSLKQDFPAETLCLIIGMDAFFGITSWFKWQSLLDLCHIVVTQRPGFDVNTIEEHFDNNDYLFIAPRLTTDTRELSKQECGKILLQSVPQLDISATQIRSSLLKGEDISQWMPEQACVQLREFMNDN
ncbi:MAG: nicotinate-nucleotide adenylyltransferase [Gammaproteobacteria bacterium]|nr:nicotinate-nucleotide adenylyltransferase [Gammaproteobacteria bacterium]